MRTHEIEICIINGKTPDFPMSLSEECLYIMLESLYRQYFRGQIPKEQASVKKQQIIKKCCTFEQAYFEWCAAHAQFQECIRKADVLMSEIEKTHDVSDIALKACEVIALLTGEASFAQRQKAKWEADT